VKITEAGCTLAPRPALFMPLREPDVSFGVQTNLVLGYRAIFALAPEARGRVNGVYLASLFAAGGLGSALGAWAYARGGWGLACCLGLVPPLLALDSPLASQPGKNENGGRGLWRRPPKAGPLRPPSY
jgi:MFS family permease